MKKILGYAWARLKEPSTWAGLAGIALAVAHGFPELAGVAAKAAGGCGALAAVLSEKGAP